MPFRTRLPRTKRKQRPTARELRDRSQQTIRKLLLGALLQLQDGDVPVARGDWVL